MLEKLFLREEVPVSPDDSVRQLKGRLDAKAIDLLPRAIEAVLQGQGGVLPDLTTGKLYRKPKIFQEFQMYFRRFKKHMP